MKKILRHDPQCDRVYFTIYKVVLTSLRILIKFGVDIIIIINIISFGVDIIINIISFVIEESFTIVFYLFLKFYRLGKMYVYQDEWILRLYLDWRLYIVLPNRNKFSLFNLRELLIVFFCQQANKSSGMGKTLLIPLLVPK